MASRYDVVRLANAISGQESGGDYAAQNPLSGAYGRYQIMPENWSSWAGEAGVGSDAEQTPENQQRVAYYKIGQLLDKYKDPAKVAQAWYAGEGSFDYSPSALSRGQEGGHPSINQYVDEVMQRMTGGYKDGMPMTGGVPRGVDINALIQAGVFNDKQYANKLTPEQIKAFADYNPANAKRQSANAMNEAVMTMMALGGSAMADRARGLVAQLGKNQAEAAAEDVNLENQAAQRNKIADIMMAAQQSGSPLDRMIAANAMQMYGIKDTAGDIAYTYEQPGQKAKQALELLGLGMKQEQFGQQMGLEQAKLAADVDYKNRYLGIMADKATQALAKAQAGGGLTISDISTLEKTMKENMDNIKATYTDPQEQIKMAHNLLETPAYKGVLMALGRSADSQMRLWGFPPQ